MESIKCKLESTVFLADANKTIVKLKPIEGDTASEISLTYAGSKLFKPGEYDLTVSQSEEVGSE